MVSDIADCGPIHYDDINQFKKGVAENEKNQKTRKAHRFEQV